MPRLTRETLHLAIHARHGLRIPATGATRTENGRQDYAVAVSDTRRTVYHIHFPSAHRADRVAWWQDLLAHLDTHPTLTPHPYSQEEYRRYAR
ncbi:hypothetical protein [Deinococcus soli (ex Cha et al. 2016)]|uniref:Uncharacterized protein n=2 Tax=Deinococcus soli (ex Cha et al. 2016) TaxID=1309411 RepID=A0AAE3XBN4_9DEIO|nr:hypothetical protein [Deinococcus soli (ex Cha et al. 2016)]MDR6218321.1 hypothetical protein [Deinococcus soli (ex Cha et al. 2016)]MDR6329061.1 hypothetical protein [Deinococcus soli (ex Cha et al. 2016)]MDR6751334.1 hypothetical protein [Deinococcus soli (ex Cha et al. 2016)]